jgi:hypothetical protein
MSATFNQFCYDILYMQACKSKECFVLCCYEYNVYASYFHYSEVVAGLSEVFKASCMVLESLS